ncbi:MAG: hypothetical protein ACI8QC_002555 [Planctomycetota bacterium]|jgi:hypothetical protein
MPLILRLHRPRGTPTGVEPMVSCRNQGCVPLYAKGPLPSRNCASRANSVPRRLNFEKRVRMNTKAALYRVNAGCSARAIGLPVPPLQSPAPYPSPPCPTLSSSSPSSASPSCSSSAWSSQGSPAVASRIDPGSSLSCPRRASTTRASWPAPYRQAC